MNRRGFTRKNYTKAYSSYTQEDSTTESISQSYVHTNITSFGFLLKSNMQENISIKNFDNNVERLAESLCTI